MNKELNNLNNRFKAIKKMLESAKKKGLKKIKLNVDEYMEQEEQDEVIEREIQEPYGEGTRD